MRIIGFKRMAWLSLFGVLIVALVWVRAARQFKPFHQRNASSLIVFAAASLNEAFMQIGAAFEGQNPGLRVELNLAGSQQLALQIEQGARVDVFASADVRWMEEVQRDGLLASTPKVFAHNRLIGIVPRSNSAHIEQLQDLARPGIKLVLAAESVPAGRYSREVLEKLAHVTGFSPGYPSAALKNLVSSEENVKEVLSKVQLGEADAGLVYYSDVTPANAGSFQVFEILESANVIANYPIASLRAASNPQAARKFIEFVLSPVGQSMLRARQFIPASPDLRNTP